MSSSVSSFDQKQSFQSPYINEKRSGYIFKRNKNNGVNENKRINRDSSLSISKGSFIMAECAANMVKSVWKEDSKNNKYMNLPSLAQDIYQDLVNGLCHNKETYILAKEIESQLRFDSLKSEDHICMFTPKTVSEIEINRLIDVCRNQMECKQFYLILSPFTSASSLSSSNLLLLNSSNCTSDSSNNINKNNNLNNNSNVSDFSSLSILSENQKELKLYNDLIQELIYHIEQDDVSVVQKIIYKNKKVIYQVDCGDAQSEEMFLLLLHNGAECNFWSYEHGTSTAAWCIKKHTQIRTC